MATMASDEEVVDVLMASADELLECYRKCKELEVQLSERQAGGKQTSGRYHKHDTARLRCLRRVVYPDLRLGKLPSLLDFKMLFEMKGPRDIAGPAKLEMDRWSNIYARDPRSSAAQKSEMERDVESQTDLLRWAVHEDSVSDF